MKNDIAISVKNVEKTFKLPHEKSSSIKSAIVNLGRRKKGYELQHVLKNISFDVKKGEFFGIVGRNGSGKSTLLKMIAGVYSNDKGTIDIDGKIVPFIELGVGFNPELTGRENVYLNGALLGFSRTQMTALYDEIVEFAELEKFMDQKLKNYSSGMQVRLAFSIAIRANSDILILDEVLAVGDEAFQRKCFSYFSALRKNKKTVILVTHDMNAVQRFCTKALILESGNIEAIGNPTDISSEYTKFNLKKPENNKNELTENKEKVKTRTGSGDATVDIKTFGLGNKKQSAFSPYENITVRISIDVHKRLNDPRVGFVIKDSNEQFVFATNTQVDKVEPPEMEKGSSFVVDYDLENIFTDGTYTISGAIVSNYDEMIYDKVEKIQSFESGGWSLKHAITHPRHTTRIKKN